MMRVVGIDPGIAHTGIAIVEYDGRQYTCLCPTTIETAANLPEHERVSRIGREILSYLEADDFDAVAIEEVYHNKNVKSSNSTNRVIGAIQFVAVELNIPVLMFRPQDGKMALGLHGNANKKLVRLSARRLFRFPIQRRFRSQHEADAAAIATAGTLKLRSGKIR